METQKVAILIDGGFFMKRYRATYHDGRNHSARQVVNNIYGICSRHLCGGNQCGKDHLYRIFYYDSKPPKSWWIRLF